VRIVALVGDTPDGRSFVTRIHEALGVDLAVVTAARSPAGAARAKLAAAGAGGVAEAVRERARERLRRRAREDALERWLGDTWRVFPADVERIVVDSPNGDEVRRRVAALDRVVLVVHAERILHEPLLRACEVALNLHWGLSPHYRGTRCTEWALLHWDPHNIGVTVHHLSSEVDGGAIVGQGRAVVHPRSTVRELDAQLTAIGTAITVDACRRLRAGERLPAVSQDLSVGFVTAKRQWSGHLQRQIERLERRGLDELLAQPSRGPVPLVEPGRDPSPS
jgi:hypothetical protein